METQSWGQVTTAVPACVPMAPEACGSLLEAVTVVITLSRPPASATQDIKVKRSLQKQLYYGIATKTVVQSFHLLMQQVGLKRNEREQMWQ